MTRDQIQTVLTALEGLNVPYGGRKQAIALLQAALAEPSEPHAWIIPMTQGKPMLTMDKVFADGARDIDGKDVVPLFTHPASNQLDEIAKVLHYPDCWDVMAYPTLEDAIIEAKSWAHCTNDDCQCPTKEA